MIRVKSTDIYILDLMFEETEKKSCIAPSQYFYFITSDLLKITGELWA